MCAKILEASGKLNLDEYNFFLRGGVVRGLGKRELSEGRGGGGGGSGMIWREGKK